jgi:hypothetical protein
MDPTHPREILESLRDHMGSTMPPRDPYEDDEDDEQANRRSCASRTKTRA